MPDEEVLIKMHEKKQPRVKIFKTLKDKEGHEVQIVRSLIDGVQAWVGPYGGKLRLDEISIDPTMGGEHKSLVVGLALIPPGNELALHSHQVEEVYTVIKGKGVMYTSTGEQQEVQWGDIIWNGPNVAHCLRNHYHEDLWVVWCWGAPKVPSAIDELEQAGEIARTQKGQYAEQFQVNLIGPP